MLELWVSASCLSIWNDNEKENAYIEGKDYILDATFEKAFMGRLEVHFTFKPLTDGCEESISKFLSTVLKKQELNSKHAHIAKIKQELKAKLFHIAELKEEREKLKSELKQLELSIAGTVTISADEEE